MTYDPTGPGTPAWEASERAINHGQMGRPNEFQAAIDEMTRELLANGASAQTIREWETHIMERIILKEPEYDDGGDMT